MPILGDTILDQVVLRCIRKWTENHEEKVSKKHYSMASDSVPAFRSLPRVPSLDDGAQAVRPNKAFTSQVAFGSDISSQK